MMLASLQLKVHEIQFEALGLKDLNNFDDEGKPHPAPLSFFAQHLQGGWMHSDSCFCSDYPVPR